VTPQAASCCVDFRSDSGNSAVGTDQRHSHAPSKTVKDCWSDLLPTASEVKEIFRSCISLPIGQVSTERCDGIFSRFVRRLACGRSATANFRVLLLFPADLSSILFGRREGLRFFEVIKRQLLGEFGLVRMGL